MSQSNTPHPPVARYQGRSSKRGTADGCHAPGRGGEKRGSRLRATTYAQTYMETRGHILRAREAGVILYSGGSDSRLGARPPWFFYFASPERRKDRGGLWPYFVQGPAVCSFALGCLPVLPESEKKNLPLTVGPHEIPKTTQRII